jgi:hypothetical protein
MSYQIKITGVLDQSWSDWLGNVDMISEKAENGSMITTLNVYENDPARLFGVLDHIRDLNITLISVTRK